MTTIQANDTLTGTPALALAFACRWCSLLGAERAGRERLALPAGFRLIPVECAGAVPLDLILRAYADGAHGVAVMGCHLGGCRHNEANRNAHAKLEMLASALNVIGVKQERLLLSWGTAHEAAQFAAQISEFIRGLETLRHKDDLLLFRNKFSTRTPTINEALHLRGDSPKYPLAKTVWRMLRANPPQSAPTVICRTCDSRAISEQERLGQFLEQSVRCQIIPCDAVQAARCSCAMPTPESPEQGAKDPRAALSPELRAFQEAPDRAVAWREAMQRCLKCYACRNVCPVCICTECRLEDPAFVPDTSLSPPPPLPWHLCRATHVAESCVNCGACQDACPAKIPLLALHTAISGHLYEKTGYLSGQGKPLPLSEAAKASGPTGTPAGEWLCRTGTGACSCDQNVSP